MDSSIIPIEYSGFHDAPLVFRVWRENGWYYFWRGYFDEKIDDYAEDYDVFRIEGKSADEPIVGWDLENFEPKDFVGKIQMTQVLFDESRRKSIDSQTFMHMHRRPRAERPL